MWLNLLVVVALTGGLLDFCIGQMELPEGSNESAGGFNESPAASIDVWSTERQEFEANPANATGAATLTTLFGGEGEWVSVEFGSSKETRATFEVLLFGFEEGSPPGWVEYVETAVDCETGDEVSLPGEAVLLVHFDEAYLHKEFIENPVGGDILPEAQRICDRDGVLEWAIGVDSRRAFRVDPQLWDEPIEHSNVAIEVLGEP